NITDNLKIKIDNCPDKEYYKDLKVGFDKLCFEYYMKIVDSYRCQISTIDRNNELDNSNLMEINDLNKKSNRFNTSANLMNINNLIEINDSTCTTLDLIEISNLIEINESEIKNSVNLIELIEAQKE
ncbi:14569_t:CDS:1, partial [Gigaspora rosea]